MCESTMGTTTFYLKHNDLGRPLSKMSKEEIEIVSKLSPYQENNSYGGWKVPLELHNGNVYLLVFWRGRLMKLEDAPKKLTNKYYDKYSGKTCKEYEWTLLKNLIVNEVNHLDKEFKKGLRKQKNRLVLNP